MEKNRVDQGIQLVSGGVAGICAALCTCPLDVIKTRLQVQTSFAGQPGHKYEGPVHAFRLILQEEGLRGFYRGINPTMLGLVPTWAIYFTVYDYLKTLQASRAETAPTSVHLSSAVVAGAISSTITSPVWLVKTRMQTQSSQGHYISTWQSMKYIKNTEGFFALYKGLAPGLLGLVHVAVQFPLYEKIKDQFKNRHPDRELTSTEVLISASVSKIVASIVAYPHEVLRSRLMNSVTITNQQTAGDYGKRGYSGLMDALKRTVHEEGVLALYKGMGANLVRVTPTACITFLAYETCLALLKSSRERFVV